MGKRILLALCMALTVFVGASSPAKADDVGHITNYVGTYDIHENGDVSAKTAMTWKFTAAISELYFLAPMGMDGKNKVTDVSVTNPDGKRVEFSQKMQTSPEGAQALYVGVTPDQAELKSGTWTFAYTVTNVLVDDPPWTVFAWEVATPNNPTIAQWSATVNSPWAPEEYMCTVNGSEQDCGATVDGTTVAFQGGELPSGSSLHVYTGTPQSATGRSGTPGTTQSPSPTSDASVPESSETETTPEATSPAEEPSPSATEEPSSDASPTDGVERDTSDGGRPDLAFFVGIFAFVGLVIGLVIWAIVRRKPTPRGP
uniref:DUF2207 domain-containing protein n=1 Tax=Tessaracoccus timonensis TaxID=2161816 RepID=UPI000D54B4A9|nr:DUF2207 domain-containing protein [Tessaracoccus timonensis]